MALRPYILAETNWKAVRAKRHEVAVLPWGATEAHNYHLPYSTDTIQCDHIAAESARLATEAGAAIMVLPTIPFGVQTGQLDIPFCLNMNPRTQAAVLADLVASLVSSGVRKLVILNGHGGNDFRQMIRELQPATPIFLSTVSWFKAIDPRPYFAEAGDHAGEMETSLMMNLAGDAVLPLSEAGAGAETPPRLAALREGWAWAPRPWTKISNDTGVGDPRQATPEKGAAFFQAATRKIASYLIDLHHIDPQDIYASRPTGA